MPTAPITVAIAGSTSYTRQCAQVLSDDPDFAITHILTPTAKLTGRKQLLTPNPLDAWAHERKIPTTWIKEKVDSFIHADLMMVTPPDLLLVVDFGYFVPGWLLSWPKKAPLNIHPSMLPRWRGSSPGQFPLLYGDEQSGVTLMIMNEAFDAGPLVKQLPFDIEPTWTAQDYYDHAFSLITQQLPTLLKQFMADELTATAQPEESPTAVAGKLTRDDGYIAWDLLSKLIGGQQPTDQCDFGTISPVLLDAFAETKNIYHVVERSIRALSPWPGVWTKVMTESGEKRLKILSAHLENSQLFLDQVQLEGKQPVAWSQQNYSAFGFL